MIFSPNIYQPKLQALDFSVDSTEVHGYTKFTRNENIQMQVSFSPFRTGASATERVVWRWQPLVGSSITSGDRYLALNINPAEWYAEEFFRSAAFLGLSSMLPATRQQIIDYEVERLFALGLRGEGTITYVLEIEHLNQGRNRGRIEFYKPPIHSDPPHGSGQGYSRNDVRAIVEFVLFNTFTVNKEDAIRGTTLPNSDIIMVWFDFQDIVLIDNPVTDYHSSNTQLIATPIDRLNRAGRSVPFDFIKSEGTDDNKTYFHCFCDYPTADFFKETGCYQMHLTWQPLSQGTKRYEWDKIITLNNQNISAIRGGEWYIILNDTLELQINDGTSGLTFGTAPYSELSIISAIVNGIYPHYGSAINSLAFRVRSYGGDDLIYEESVRVDLSHTGGDHHYTMNTIRVALQSILFSDISTYSNPYEVSYDLGGGTIISAKLDLTNAKVSSPEQEPTYNPDRVLAVSEVFEIIDKPDNTVLINFKHYKDLLGTMFTDLETDYKFRVAGTFRQELPEWGGSNEEFNTHDNRNVRLSGYPTEIFTLTLGTLQGLPRETVTKILLALQCKELIINGIPCKMVAGQNELDVVERYMNGNTIFNIKVQPAQNKYVSGSAKTALHAGGQTPYTNKNTIPAFV